jgi:5'-3' exonuclease
LNRPTTCVLDGDILAYRAAFWADAEGSEWLENRLIDDVKRWTPACCTKTVIALSCRREDNFRRDWLPQYKAHRDSSYRPDCLNLSLEIMKQMPNVVEMPRLEADDIMGMMKSSGEAVCVTIDKDLKSVPGWAYRPQIDPDDFPAEVEFHTEQEADRWFYRQWITGDSTDNIPGIWKMGQAKAEKALGETTPFNWPMLVMSLYERKPTKDGGKYTYQDAIAMARAVRILRHGEVDTPWNPPI